MSRPTAFLLTAAVATTVAALLTACGGNNQAPTAERKPITIEVSVTRCGTGWTRPAAGRQHFVLANTDTRAGEVYLTDAASGAVYAEVDPLGPGTRAPLDVDLGSGRYTFRCAMEDEATVAGPAVTIPGHVRRPTEPVAAVTQADLIAATRAYEAYVRGRIPVLTGLTATLQEKIAAGDLAAARQAWLPAHLEYERLGAAYDAFGDLDDAINGLPHGLPGGVHDPGWAGFHRIEYGLWHGESAASLRKPADDLRQAVGRLGGEFSGAQIAPLELSVRAHEISENALQTELTGAGDYGSHSSLATVRANLDGTRTVLGIIRPLLASRFDGLPTVTAALEAAGNDLDGLRRPDGSWPPLGALGPRDRRRVDADLSQLSELLAPVASILEPRRES